MKHNGTDNLLMDFLGILNRLKEQLYTIDITPFKHELVIIARKLDRRKEKLNQQVTLPCQFKQACYRFLIKT